MFESRDLPPYPPLRNAWEFPPPPVSRGWLWGAIAATTVSAVLGIGLLAIAIVVGNKDFPSMIQDERLLSVITRECHLMTSTVESMPVTGRPREQAEIITDQNQAVEKMLDAIRAVDGDVRSADRPTNDWLDDWERLIGARERFAAQIVTGAQPDLDIPRDSSGNDIYLRMDDVWLDGRGCEVPEALLNPYPENTSTI